MSSKKSKEPMSICDNCSEAIPMAETNACECGGNFCNDCIHPAEHDCEAENED